MYAFSRKLSVVLSVLSVLSAAQTTAPLTFRQITANAGYIFSGTVAAVERVPATRPNEVDTMRITFHVDQGVKGAHSRQSLTIREWGGLWNAGEKYQVGERVVLMLYPPSKLGLTSPVAGSLGRFVVDGTGRLTLPPQQAETLAADPVVGPWLQGRTRTSGREFARILRRVAKE